MRHLSRRLFLGAALAAPALAQDRKSDDGFTPIFDGRTLRGWAIEEGPESAFYVDDDALVVHPGASSPTWLRSEREYENFDLRGEFFVRGWTDSGVFLHAPRHGPPAWCGMEMKIFHQVDKVPASNSMGAILPVLAPSKVNVHKDWNDFRILADWPSLCIWTNGEPIQDVNLESTGDLKYRLRRGFLGIPTVAAACRFRNLRIRELPGKDVWSTLYQGPGDFGKWYVSEGAPKFETLGPVLRGDGSGHIATKEKYRDFALQMYIRASRQHNGGVLFRSAGEGLKNPRHYEIQLHNVEEAHFPTGSLYYYKRAKYPRIEDEKWFLFQMWAQGRSCLVRINGENVLEYDQLENVDEGAIELQAHNPGHWTEYQQIRVKRL
jgi:Domain of Unknown Function (DUF1080)